MNNHTIASLPAINRLNTMLTNFKCSPPRRERCIQGAKRRKTARKCNEQLVWEMRLIMCIRPAAFQSSRGSKTVKAYWQPKFTKCSLVGPYLIKNHSHSNSLFVCLFVCFCFPNRALWDRERLRAMICTFPAEKSDSKSRSYRRCGQTEW